MLAEDEERLLSQHDDVIILQVDVVVHCNLPCLLANICDPRRLHLRLLIILLFLLYLLLLLQVIVRERLHWVEIVALDLEVAVGNNEAVRSLREDHWPWDKKVRELYFEEHVVVIEEVERAINWLDTDLIIFVAFVSKLAAHEIVRVPLEPVDLALGDLREFVRGFNDMHG